VGRKAAWPHATRTRARRVYRSSLRSFTCGMEPIVAGDPPARHRHTFGAQADPRPRLGIRTRRVTEADLGGTTQWHPG
jgi:hypothetical protein